ncbi:hypothetical protein Syun_006154 [Stephania yunnanensis]|uniref:Secreted protein n=1 Tax=Stephania yunnanensis TaxID=152371 RepID=A0AAP0KXI2_9MAGN
MRGIWELCGLHTAVGLLARASSTSVLACELQGMDCTMKADVGKVLADALRYYYFDMYFYALFHFCTNLCQVL